MAHRVPGHAQGAPQPAAPGKACAPASAQVVRLAGLPGIACPCGTARRAFAEAAEGRASLHLVEVKQDSERHYHRRLTEIYYVLSGDGQKEIDGELRALTPGDAVFIPPGIVHRAIPGTAPMTILNFVMPAFDPEDEWVVE